MEEIDNCPQIIKTQNTMGVSTLLKKHGKLYFKKCVIAGDHCSSVSVFIKSSITSTFFVVESSNNVKRSTDMNTTAIR